MLKVIQSPGKYVQGKDVLTQIGHFASQHADRYLALCDPFVLDRISKPITDSFASSKTGLLIEAFKGECSQNEIHRILAILKQNNCHGCLLYTSDAADE